MTEIKKYDMPRKFCFIGFDREENRFDLYQVYANNENEAKAEIENQGLAFLNGGFLDDINGNYISLVSAQDDIQKAADEFTERKRLKMEEVRRWHYGDDDAKTEEAAKEGQEV